MLKCDIFFMGDSMECSTNAANLLTPNDLRLTTCGTEQCCPGHAFGPYIRSFDLIHLVLSGKGRFVINKKEYELCENSLFFIPKDVVTFYQADKANPWKYSWIGLSGIKIDAYLKSAGLSEKNPVMAFNEELISPLSEIIDYTKKHESDSPFVIGNLYLFIDKLIKCGGSKEKYKSRSQLYVESAVNFIHERIYEKITINDLSDYIGIDRSYFCAVFKKHIGISPQNYILNTKMEMAKSFLTTTDTEIKYIASSLGYDDQFVFSHAFKVKTGYSPREWRNLNK